MCCLFTVLVLLGPRIGGAIWWIAQPVRWVSNAGAFDTWIWPLLGLIVLPWTTIMYVAVSPNGVTGFDWVWLVLAIIVDVGTYGGGGYGNRNQIPGYSS